MSGDVRERRDDDLVTRADADQFARHVERRGAAARGNDRPLLGKLEPGPHPPLELLGERSQGQPSGVERGRDGGMDFGPEVRLEQRQIRNPRREDHLAGKAEKRGDRISAARFRDRAGRAGGHAARMEAVLLARLAEPA